MRKLILAMFMIFAISVAANAQSYIYQAKFFAMKMVNSTMAIGQTVATGRSQM